MYLRPSPSGKITYLQASDLQMSPSEKTTLKVDFVPKLSRYMLQQGDILFAGKGTKYLCQTFNLNIQAVPSTTLYIIRPDRKQVLPEYLCWFLNLPQTETTIKAMQVGSSMPMILKSSLEEVEIPIPDLATQSHILEIANLQQREQQLLASIAEKRVQVTNQILYKLIDKS
ncbi:MAG: restriction endonuclease subunit S [Bacteroidales bacterium]|nr:restriction endonuclease subunit S [Bacteroidales bacterium]